MGNPEKLSSKGTQDEDKHINNVNKTWALLLRTEGKDEPHIVKFYAKIVTDFTTRNSERKDT